MMYAQDAYENLRGGKESVVGKFLIAIIIAGANLAAGGLYPIWRLYNAWCESGEIDFSVIGESIRSGAEKCLGAEVVASFTAGCSCLAKSKEHAEMAQESAEDLAGVAGDIREISAEQMPLDVVGHAEDVRKSSVSAGIVMATQEMEAREEMMEEEDQKVEPEQEDKERCALEAGAAAGSATATATAGVKYGTRDMECAGESQTAKTTAEDSQLQNLAIEFDGSEADGAGPVPMEPQAPVASPLAGRISPQSLDNQ